MAKDIGYGATLEYTLDLQTPAWVEVGNIVDSIENETTVEEVDTTLLGDQYKTFAPADIDPGELNFNVALDPDAATDAALVTLLGNGNIAGWQITYPNSATTDVFKGWVKTLGRRIAKRSLMTRNIVIRLTDDPTLS